MKKSYIAIPLELTEKLNIEDKTLGGHFCWDTVDEQRGIKLQVNKFFKNARLIDNNNIRIAWGNQSEVEAKFAKIMSGDYPEYGDVLFVKRKIPANYRHYAIYVGDDKVIHFAAEGDDFGGKITIHEADISDFLRDSDRYYTLSFLNDATIDGKKSFSAEETVERARNVMGQNEYNYNKKYNLVSNNCEHFALWCKLGISKSSQVEIVRAMLSSISPLFLFVKTSNRIPE